MLPAMNARSLINEPRTAPPLNELWENIVFVIRAEMSAPEDYETSVRYIW